MISSLNYFSKPLFGFCFGIFKINFLRFIIFSKPKLHLLPWLLTAFLTFVYPNHQALLSPAQNNFVSFFLYLLKSWSYSTEAWPTASALVEYTTSSTMFDSKGREATTFRFGVCFSCSPKWCVLICALVLCVHFHPFLQIPIYKNCDSSKFLFIVWPFMAKHTLG